MISLLKQYWRSLAWFISGVAIAALLSLATPDQQPATALNRSADTTSTQPLVNRVYLSADFAATHQEPNFYQ